MFESNLVFPLAHSIVDFGTMINSSMDPQQIANVVRKIEDGMKYKLLTAHHSKMGAAGSLNQKILKAGHGCVIHNVSIDRMSSRKG